MAYELMYTPETWERPHVLAQKSKYHSTACHHAPLCMSILLSYDIVVTPSRMFLEPYFDRRLELFDQRIRPMSITPGTSAWLILLSPCSANMFDPFRAANVTW
jgi:hypothetical protein